MRIRRVTDRAARARIGALVALSFDHLDANHFLVPDPQRRLDIMTDYFTLHTQHADRVLQTSNGMAAVVLFDRMGPVTEPPDYRKRVDQLAGPYADRFAHLDAVLDAHHPERPHWHLAFLAVHPHHQRTGLGTALLAHTHRWMDGLGLPTYLEATNVDNARLYRREGYRSMTPSTMKAGDATFRRMWRNPQ